MSQRERGSSRGEAAEALASLGDALVAAHPDCQVFIFGPEGDPFWTARDPVRSELQDLDRALARIEELEASWPRPFSYADPVAGFVVGALDEEHDLYFVVLQHGLEPQAAEARVVAVRALCQPRLVAVREELCGRRLA
jgi:hypothetical protein